MREEHAILLVILAILVFIVCIWFIKRKDGFTDLIDVQKEFIEERRQNYNSLGLGLISSNTVGNLGTDTRPLVGTPDQVAIPETGKLGNVIKDKFPMKPGKSGIFGFVEKCEAVKSADCSVFDDPTFGKNCGLCLEVGMNSQNEPSMGGMVLLPDDRKLVEYPNTPLGFLPDYVPTLGSCPAGKMVTTKAQCIKLTNEMLCAKNASYTATPGCSQCYGDGTYFPVDPNTAMGKTNPKISVIGNGILRFIETGYQDIPNIKLGGEPYEIYLKGKENTRLTFDVKPCTIAAGCSEAQVRKPVTIAGSLTGEILNGDTTFELGRLIITDSVTGRKPLTKGAVKVGDLDVRVMGPGFGKDSMTLIGSMPFTFLDTSSEEVSKCSTGPYVTTATAAAFLESDPCYKTGTGPGKYSMECLQNTMDANGCFSAGKGYPKDPASAAKLLTDEKGKARTIDEIANYIYEQAVITSTGVNLAGNTLTLPEQSSASLFCTGVPITSPCDFGNKDTGPLTLACIDYLWKNTGSSKALGPTYDRFSQASSLFSKGKGPRFCQSSGTLAPVDDTGNVNTQTLEYWQGLGGVKAVKAAMAQVHLDANSEMGDDDKREALLQCYGTSLANRPPASSAVASGCKYSCGSPIQKVRLTKTNDDGTKLQCGQLAIYNSTGENVALASTVVVTGTDGSAGSWNSTTAQINDGKMYPHFGFIAKSPKAYVMLDLGTTMDIISVVYYSTTAGAIQNWSIGLMVEALDSNDNVLFTKTIETAADYQVFNLRSGSADPGCMACENNTGKQVYWIARGAYGPEYSLVMDDAIQTCASLGAKVATQQQINAAVTKGLDQCASGWVKTGASSYNNFTPNSANCGSAVDEGNLPSVSPPGNPILSGAWCYGKKPSGDSLVFGGAYRKIALDAYRPFFIRGFAPGIFTGPLDMPGNSV